jgi:hypothetical protein
MPVWHDIAVAKKKCQWTKNIFILPIIFTTSLKHSEKTKLSIIEASI